MSYRVETASSGRAVCKATECKDAGIKIDKDELRLGSWVPFEDRGSWAWKHWGCVSGKQIQNIRTYLEDPERPGTYRWDFLDGYEGDEKNSLDKHPDLQEKVRRVITQGFIDPEDWNGDPEMNKLGETGIRTAESKKKMREDKKARANEIAELNAKLEAMTAERDVLKEGAKSRAKMDNKVEELQKEIDKKAGDDGKKKPSAPKKRARAKEESGDEEGAFEDAKPAKKKRATKAKKEADDDDDEPKPVPAKKSLAKKAVKKEEDADMDAEDSKPVAKRSRAKKAVKKEEVKDEDDFDAPPVVTAPKKRTTRGKKVVKEEPADGGVAEDAGDPEDAEPVEEPEVKQPAKRGRKKAVKKEVSA